MQIVHSTDQSGLTTAKAVVLSEGTVTIAASIGEISGSVTLTAFESIYYKISKAYDNGTGSTDYPVGTMLDITAGELFAGGDPAGHTVFTIKGTGGNIDDNGVTKTGRPQFVMQYSDTYADEEYSPDITTNWGVSHLREWMNNDWLNTMPELFKLHVKTTNVQFRIPGDSGNSISQDKIWAPSISECTGSSPSEGGRMSGFNSALSLQWFYLYNQTSRRRWWTRTVQGAGSVYYVLENGTTSVSSPIGSTTYARPAFCL